MLKRAFLVISLTFVFQSNLQAGDDFIDIGDFDKKRSASSTSQSNLPLQQELRQRKLSKSFEDSETTASIISPIDVIDDYTQKVPLTESEKQQDLEKALLEYQNLKRKQQELEKQLKILEQKESGLEAEIANQRETLQALMRPGYARYINPVTVLAAGGVGLIQLYQANNIAGAIGAALYIIYLFRLLQGVYVQGYSYLN